jgi:hypothetical protein
VTPLEVNPLDRMHGLVLGYHGCDQATAERVLSGKEELKHNKNDYDWLGHGAYFWENDPERALAWAKQKSQMPKSDIKTPAVLCAIIDLGSCLNLIRSEHLSLLKATYAKLEQDLRANNLPLPRNEPLKKGGDLVLRRLDCAVIEALCAFFEESKVPLDSVRGVFFEDDELYPEAGFKLGNHIQICVRNPRCIKGYFRPRDY